MASTIATMLCIGIALLGAYTLGTLSHKNIMEIRATEQKQAPDLKECMRAIKQECDHHTLCQDCPMVAICDAASPAGWYMTEELNGGKDE